MLEHLLPPPLFSALRASERESSRTALALAASGAAAFAFAGASSALHDSKHQASRRAPIWSLQINKLRVRVYDTAQCNEKKCAENRIASQRV